MIVIEEGRGDKQPSKVLLEASCFWVQVYDLPFNLRGGNVVSAIRSKIRKVTEVDLEDYGNTFI